MMKKVLSLVMVCLLVMSFTVMAIVPAAAASAQDTIISALKDTVPAEHLNKYLPAVENVMQQLEITDEQATEIVACIAAADAAIEEYHYSLHKYSEKERAAVIEQLDKVCAILKVRYEIKVSEDAKHSGDEVAVFYKEDGTKLADVDFDAVKKTNTPSNVSAEFIVLAIAMMAGAIATAVYAKKAVSAR